MTLGDAVKNYREQTNISMDEFSKRCSLSKGYISMLENNVNPRSNKPIAPTLPTIEKIAKGMNTDVDSLLRLIDDNQQISLDENQEEDFKKTFARNLNNLLAINKKTQVDLVNDLGFNKATVSTWCNGIKVPRMDKIDMICDYFGISRSGLMEENQHKNTDATTERYMAYAKKLMEKGLMEDDLEKIIRIWEAVKDDK